MPIAIVRAHETLEMNFQMYERVGHTANSVHHKRTLDEARIEELSAAQGPGYFDSVTISPKLRI